MLRTILSLTMLAVGLWLVGCNTVNGMGKDIKAAGQSIEDASKKK